MDNIGMMEINEIRFLNQSMDRLRLLNAAKYDRDDTTEIDGNGEYD
jgi:hypothetical protein